MKCHGWELYGEGASDAMRMGSSTVSFGTSLSSKFLRAPRSVFGGLALSGEDAEALARALDAAAKRLPAVANASQGLAGALSLRGIVRDAGTPDEIRAKVAEAFDPWTAGGTGGEALRTGDDETGGGGAL